MSKITNMYILHLPKCHDFTILKIILQQELRVYRFTLEMDWDFVKN